MPKPWLRLYRDALNNPKIGKLGLEATGMWAICLMLSDDEGALPDAAGISWASRYHVDAVTEMMETLLRNGLVTRYGNGYRLHDWAQHQRASDHDQGGSERQKRFRERKKAQSSAVTDSNALRNGDVTLSDTDTDTDTEEKKELTTFVPKKIVTPETRGEGRKMERKGTRWPDGAIVPNDWLPEGDHARNKAGLKSINLATQAILFQNYWSSKSGAAATKIDWKKTWINWCLTAKETGNDNRTTQTTRTGNTFNALLGEYRRNKERVPEE